MNTLPKKKEVVKTNLCEMCQLGSTLVYSKAVGCHTDEEGRTSYGCQEHLQWLIDRDTKGTEAYEMKLKVERASNRKVIKHFNEIV